MLLTVDAGNTNTVFSLFLGDEIAVEARMATNAMRMGDEYIVFLTQILNSQDVSFENISGAIISSVVPSATPQIKYAIEKLFNISVMIVEPGLKTGVNLKIQEQITVGADLISVCAAVKARGKFPAIIIDAGTATKILALDKSGSFIGGTLFPGISVCLNSLSNSTALLPQVGAYSAKSLVPISGDTATCIRSGVILGTADMISGFIDRFEKELGIRCYIVGTGGHFEIIEPHLKRETEFSPSLISEGLKYIFEKNVY